MPANPTTSRQDWSSKENLHMHIITMAENITGQLPPPYSENPLQPDTNVDSTSIYNEKTTAQNYYPMEEEFIVGVQPPVMTIIVQPRPPNHSMLFAIITAFISLPFGMAAIFLSCQSEQSYFSGDYETGQRLARMSKCVSLAGISVGGVMSIILIVILVT